MAPWYEVVAGSALAQGDLLLRCPVPRVDAVTHPLPDEFDVAVDEHDLVVLSQSCDLENDKVDEVLLAAVLDYDALVEREGAANPLVKGKKWRKAAVNGDLHAYSVLPQYEAEPPLPWSLADFHHLFTLPKTYVESVALSVPGRLRLVPPYREHLAQAFARYMMRVGLPAALDAFVNRPDN